MYFGFKWCLNVWLVAIVLINGFKIGSQQQRRILWGAIRYVPKHTRIVCSAELSSSRGVTVPILHDANKASSLSKPSKNLVKYHDPKNIDPSEPATFGFIKVGKILAAHGVKGDVKVLFESDFVSQHVKVSSTLYIRKPGRRSPRPVLITASRRQGVTADNTFLMQLNGIQSRTIAETLRHYEVYVKDVTSKPKLSKDEFLIRDMVGMNCYMLSDYDAVCTGAGTGAVVTNKAQSVEGNMSGPRPVGIVAGVVPADELCDGAAAAQLMHAQIEIQLVTSAADPIKEEETQQISTVSVRSALRQSLIGRKKNVDVSSSRYGQSVRKLPNCKKATLQYCLVPLVRSIVPVVDAARRCIFLDPPAGLLQLTYELPDKLGPVRGFLPQHIAYLTEEHRQYLHARTTVT